MTTKTCVACSVPRAEPLPWCAECALDVISELADDLDQARAMLGTVAHRATVVDVDKGNRVLIRTWIPESDWTRMLRIGEGLA